MSPRVGATLACLGALLAGCAGQGPSTTPAQALAAKARSAARATYAARYDDRTAAGDATLTVSKLRNGVRVDVLTSGVTAVYIGTDSGTVSCRLAVTSRLCFTPSVVDPGIERFFTTYPQQLADHIADFTVRRQGPCFAVRPRTGAPTPTLVAGTYCFDQSGLASVRETNGNVLTREKVLPAPRPSILTPPVSPQPVPSLSPSP